jgi:hypothetical protein
MVCRIGRDARDVQRGAVALDAIVAVLQGMPHGRWHQESRIMGIVAAYAQILAAVSLYVHLGKVVGSPNDGGVTHCTRLFGELCEERSFPLLDMFCCWSMAGLTVDSAVLFTRPEAVIVLVTVLAASTAIVL